MSKTKQTEAIDARVAPRVLYNCEPCTIVILGVPLQPGPDGTSVPFSQYSRMKSSARFQTYVRDGSIRADKYAPRTALRPHSVPQIDLSSPEERAKGARRRASRPMITPGVPDSVLLAEVASDPKMLEGEIERAKAHLRALESARSVDATLLDEVAEGPRAAVEPAKTNPGVDRATTQPPRVEPSADPTPASTDPEPIRAKAEGGRSKK